MRVFETPRRPGPDGHHGDARAGHRRARAARRRAARRPRRERRAPLDVRREARRRPDGRAASGRPTVRSSCSASLDAVLEAIRLALQTDLGAEAQELLHPARRDDRRHVPHRRRLDRGRHEPLHDRPARREDHGGQLLRAAAPPEHQHRRHVGGALARAAPPAARSRRPTSQPVVDALPAGRAAGPRSATTACSRESKYVAKPDRCVTRITVTSDYFDIKKMAPVKRAPLLAAGVRARHATSSSSARTWRTTSSPPSTRSAASSPCAASRTRSSA